ncbi:glutamate--cysteine ligase [uncultured Xylophilus sp.]|uniref:glutamate--cysteine ligase n=1 Tax=uncultured Xylophilus sp. TaxID=296832 RepID=UPI0025DA9F10|nr:glutamate--cysteine ligase [uncultured Xylophilus sp.]
MVPHLITALTGPINELEQRILDSMPAIERWFRLEWMEHTPPFYSSVDLRNAGFKLAPVDTSLFPVGWNHLTSQMVPLAVQAAMAAIEKICPEARNLLLIPANHSDSPDYLANVAQLAKIFHSAGLNVRIGSVDPTITDTTVRQLPSGEIVTLEPVVRIRGRLATRYFDPCTVLLNTDLSAGAPGILEDLHEQYLLPPLHAGWTVRRKSTHFRNYEDVSKRFGKMLGIDPWLVHSLFGACGDIDLAAPEGRATLAEQVDAVLARVRRKYKEYGIGEKPFVIVKPDNAGEGVLAAETRGVATVRDARDLDGIDLRGDDGTLPRNLIVQEGVPTSEHVGKASAEPVVYMMDRYVVGGFYRVNGRRGPDESLASPGASVVPLDFDDSAHLMQPGGKSAAEAPNRFYMYGVIGRLAMLAASYELEATDPEAEVYE